MKEKQYVVEVVERHQHGRYGKRFYFERRMSGLSKKDAENKMFKFVSGLTFDEINSMCVDKKMKPWECWHQFEHESKNGKSAPIGMELAEAFFGFRGRILK